MAGGMDVVSGGMRVHAGVAQFKAGIYVTGGQTVMAGGMTVTGGVTVKSHGVSVTGGITVAGGLTVSDTGITLSGTTFTGSTPGSAGLELTTSDRRLKERLQKISTPLETLDKLKGVYYYWTKESQRKHNYDARRHLGFLAQDVGEALPEAVDTIKEGQYLGVDYTSVVPLITEGIKDLTVITDELTVLTQSHDTQLEELREDNLKLRAIIERQRRLFEDIPSSRVTVSNDMMERRLDEMQNQFRSELKQERTSILLLGTMLASVLYLVFYAGHSYWSLQAKQQEQVRQNIVNNN
jgi:hypothetical protein